MCAMMLLLVWFREALAPAEFFRLCVCNDVDQCSPTFLGSRTTWLENTFAAAHI